MQKPISPSRLTRWPPPASGLVRATALAFAAALIIPQAANAEEKYTMDDLKALDQSSDWGELIVHLKDVRPSLRKAEWKAMAERAGIGRIAEFEKRNEKQTAYAEADRILLELPMLKESRPFLDKRAAAGLAMFQECLNHRGGKPCVDGLEGLVNTDPSNDQLAFDAGKMVRQGFNNTVAVKFFHHTIKKNDKRCDDEALWLAVQSALGDPPGDYANMGTDIAFDRCAAPMKAKTEKLFLSYSPSSYGFRNLCDSMKKAKRLSKFQTAVCQDAESKS